MIRPPPPSTLFPYTTLFRSDRFAALGLAGDFPLQAIAHFLRFAVLVRRGGGPRGEGHLGHAHVRRFHDHLGILDRKSTRLNSSHANISYAVFCLKKKNTHRLDGCPGANGLEALERRPRPSGYTQSNGNKPDVTQTHDRGDAAAHRTPVGRERDML